MEHSFYVPPLDEPVKATKFTLRPTPDFTAQRAVAEAAAESRRQAAQDARRGLAAHRRAHYSPLHPITGAPIASQSGRTTASHATVSSTTAPALQGLQHRNGTTGIAADLPRSSSPPPRGPSAPNFEVQAQCRMRDSPLRFFRDPAGSAAPVDSFRAVTLRTGLLPSAQDSRCSSVLGLGRFDLASTGAVEALAGCDYGDGGNSEVVHQQRVQPPLGGGGRGRQSAAVSLHPIDDSTAGGKPNGSGPPSSSYGRRRSVGDCWDPRPALDRAARSLVRSQREPNRVFDPDTSSARIFAAAPDREWRELREEAELRAAAAAVLPAGVATTTPGVTCTPHRGRGQSDLGVSSTGTTTTTPSAAEAKQLALAEVSIARHRGLRAAGSLSSTLGAAHVASQGHGHSDTSGGGGDRFGHVAAPPLHSTKTAYAYSAPANLRGGGTGGWGGAGCTASAGASSGMGGGTIEFGAQTGTTTAHAGRRNSGGGTSRTDTASGSSAREGSHNHPNVTVTNLRMHTTAKQRCDEQRQVAMLT